MIWYDKLLIIAAAVIGIAVVCAAVFCVAVARPRRKGGHGTGDHGQVWDRDKTEIKIAGNRGEAQANRQIRQVLHGDDILLINVELTFEGMRTELDTVIVNTYGVFIIEVKNYKGMLHGGENDFEWTKVKITPGGQRFEKAVKNPLKQVKRQTYILAKYLEQHGVRAWVTGFALLLQGNSPVTSEHMLTSLSDLDRRIHTPGKTRVSADTAARIHTLLKRKR